MLLEEYYSQCELYMPDNARWRIFKFIKDNKCLRLYIRDRQELRKKLLEFLPDDVYYSTACFLNPKRAKTAKEPFLSNRNLLYADVCFDFDAHDIPIYAAASYAKNAMKVLKKHFPQLKRKYILFSGGGFHVVYKHKIPEIPNPKEREKFIREEREKMICKLKDKYIDFDEEITRDLNRVIRLPLTINRKRNQISKIIGTRSLSNFIIPKTLEIGDDKNRLGSVALDDTYVDWNLQNDEDSEGLGDNFHPLLSNEIYGMNRWCLFLIYYRTLYFVRKDIRRLQRIYNLSDVYIFKRSKNLYYAICLQTFQRRRLEKIIKKSKSDKTQLKFNRTWLKLPFYYIETMPTERRNIFISRQHLSFLKKMFPAVQEEYPKQHGDKLTLISAKYARNISS